MKLAHNILFIHSAIKEYTLEVSRSETRLLSMMKTWVLVIADVTMTCLLVWLQPQISWLANFKGLCLNGFFIRNVPKKQTPVSS